MNMPPPETEKSFHYNLATNSKRRVACHMMVVSPCGSQVRKQRKPHDCMDKTSVEYQAWLMPS